MSKTDDRVVKIAAIAIVLVGGLVCIALIGKIVGFAILVGRISVFCAMVLAVIRIWKGKSDSGD